MEKEPICIADCFLDQASAPKGQALGEDTFRIKTGGTTYEVTTHFNSEGRQSVLGQFRDLILSEHLISYIGQRQPGTVG